MKWSKKLLIISFLIIALTATASLSTSTQNPYDFVDTEEVPLSQPVNG